MFVNRLIELRSAVKKLLSEDSGDKDGLHK